jgi:hypothetical protein
VARVQTRCLSVRFTRWRGQLFCLGLGGRDHLVSKPREQRFLVGICMDGQDPGVTSEVLEHAVFALSCDDERLDWHGWQVRDDVGQLLRETLDIGQIGDYEPGQAGEG